MEHIEHIEHPKKLDFIQIFIEFNAGWVGGVANVFSGHPLE